MNAKTGRKPIGAVAMTAAQRKAEQVIRMEVAIQEDDSSEWTAAVCLHVLRSAKWQGGAIGRAAWMRLGELRGYCDSHK